MNKLKLTLEEDGSVSQYTPDFKIMRGSYRNILINLEVPHSLLLEPTKDTDDNNRTTGNNVRIGAVITTATGKHIQTQRYEFQRVKDFVRDGITYRLYQRRMPKEFTMWETVNETESTESGQVTLVINVINWVVNDTETKVEEITASPKFIIDIYPSAFLDEAEEIDEPSDFDELQSQVQEIDAELETVQEDINTNTKNIATEILERKSVDEDLQAQISANDTNITTLNTSLSKVQTAISNDLGKTITLEFDDTTYILSAVLKNAQGKSISSSEVTLPFGKLVTSTKYSNGVITLTFDSGESISVDVKTALGLDDSIILAYYDEDGYPSWDDDE